ncbi:MAG: phosphodiester glycosidase family protein [Deltaproteobacteria bacterium]|nr:phosphodiester glycosidase family protein [Deltaproteobacteria bacterium]
MPHRSLVCVAAIALATSVSTAPAGAIPTRLSPVVDHVEQLRPGVQYRSFREGPTSWHLVSISLRDKALEIFGTDESSVRPSQEQPRAGYRWTRTSTFAERTNADIAINANYYELGKWRSVCGLAMSQGNRWQSGYDDRRLNCFASAGFGTNGQASVFDSRGLRRGGSLPSWMQLVVSGSPALVRDGELVEIRHPRHALMPNPRTAIGLSRDHGTLYLLLVDGREGHAVGMTCRQSASLLRSLGAWDAINLDGGGSSALFLRSHGGVVNHTGEAERPVVNHLGLRFSAPDRHGNKVAAVSEGLAATSPVRMTAQTPRALGTPSVLRRRPVQPWRDTSLWASMLTLGIMGVLGRRNEPRGL